MVYNTQNYWVLRLYQSSGFLKKLEKTTFRKLDLFLSSDEGGDTLLGPLERVNLNHWTTYVSITTAI
jgi:hypothetical protein